MNSRYVVTDMLQQYHSMSPQLLMAERGFSELNWRKVRLKTAVTQSSLELPLQRQRKIFIEMAKYAKGSRTEGFGVQSA